MKKIGLTVYGLDVHRNRSYSIDNAEGDLDFISIVDCFASATLNGFDIDANSENIFKFESVEREAVSDEDGHLMFNAITGIVKTGEYGTEAEIVHAKTGKTTHKKTVEEAEVLPFAFYLALSPVNPNKGIVIFQTEGRYGMKTAFSKRLHRFVREKFEGWGFSLGNIMPKEYLERYLVKGFLKEIRVIKYGISQDVSERNGIKGNDDEMYEERILHNPLGFLDAGAEKVRELLRGQRSLCNIVEIPDFDYDCLKFNFRMGKNSKTIDLANLDSLVVTEDITEQAGVKKGHPEADILKKEMRETAKGYMTSTDLA